MASTAVSSSSRSSSSRKVVEKITARVFCRADVATKGGAEGGGGGNPLTIFSFQNNNNNTCDDHTITRRRRLAETCDWESVMVDHQTNQVSFHLPNGNPVRFCAHAAMGAAVQLAAAATTTKARNSGAAVRSSKNIVDFETIDHDKLTATVHDTEDDDDHVVALDVVDTPARIELIDHPPTLYRILRDAFGLQASDLTKRGEIVRYPTFVNSYVFGRPKTLVSVNSIETLHQICPPSSPDAFRDACDALNTTGIYLHAKEGEGGGSSSGDDNDNSAGGGGGDGGSMWECRQFPRDSGYPEDPATGVAAVSLAIALHPFYKRTEYQFLQGTAMGRPSLIVVQDLNLQQEKQQQLEDDDDADADSTSSTTLSASFQLLGRVEVDNKETIEIEDDGGG